jgi:uncharacterized membrane protein YgcG
MMKFRIAVATVALALSGATAAHAQIQPPQDRINAALSRARGAGIPVALLESKMAEGKAKGIPLERIAAAIERREGALERASQALRVDPGDAASLSVGADAIESGVSEAVLKAVAEDAPRDRRTVAIATLTQLVQQGDLPAAALAKVRNALKRGPDALTNLPSEGNNGNGNGNGNGRGRGSANGQGQGNSGGRGGSESGPPAAVPSPGKAPQASKPDKSDNGNQGRGNDPGKTNPGRGRQ